MEKNSMKERISVVVRARPFVQPEEKEDGRYCLEILPSLNKIRFLKERVRDEKRTIEPYNFNFDQIYDLETTQSEIFLKTAEPIVESAIHGFNGAIICYGQTCSGKTFTCEGTPQSPGIIPRSLEYIFSFIKQSKNTFLVQCTMCQIHKEKIYDLLSDDSSQQPLQIRQHRNKKHLFHVPQLKKFIVHSPNQWYSFLQKKLEKSRVVRKTGKNDQSSRSHAIFTFSIESRDEITGITTTGELQICDLAGSERWGATGGKDFKEMANINMGLTVLSNVIRKLTVKKKSNQVKNFIPYRNSKLTMLLKSSLGGNTRTAMIVNISPSRVNSQETYLSLTYAQRAKEVWTRPSQNVNKSGHGDLERLRKEIENLRLELEKEKKSSQVKELIKFVENPSSSSSPSAKTDEKELEQERQEWESRLKEEKKIAVKREEEASKKRNILEQRLEKLQTRVIRGGGQLEKQQQRNLKMKKLIGEMRDSQQRRDSQFQNEIKQKQEEEKKLIQILSKAEEKEAFHVKKLRELFRRCKAAEEEVEDLNQLNEEKEMRYIRKQKQQEKEMKFLRFVINNFVPKEEMKKIRDRAIYNEEDEEFQLENVQLSGNQILKLRNQSSKRRRNRNILDFTVSPISEGEDIAFW